MRIGQDNIAFNGVIYGFCLLGVKALPYCLEKFVLFNGCGLRIRFFRSTV